MCMVKSVTIERLAVWGTTGIPASWAILATRIPRVSADVTSFSESVAETNLGLVRGYKRIQNEM